MLDDYKRIYEKVADKIPNWRKKSKSELMNGYVRAETFDKSLAEAYLSAIMCKYWSILPKYYYNKSHSEKLYIEDCYDWFTHAVIYALEHKAWTKPYVTKVDKKTGDKIQVRNELYDNPEGPNIAMNQCLASARLVFYQSANNSVRKINYKTASLDQLFEDKNDSFLNSDSFISEDNTFQLNLKSFIKHCFETHKEIYAVIADAIINCDSYEYKKIFDKTCVCDEDDVVIKEVTEENKKDLTWYEKRHLQRFYKNTVDFSKKKLVKNLKHIDENYVALVAKTFGLSVEKLLPAYKDIKRTKYDDMFKIVDKALEYIKNYMYPDKEKTC